MATTREPATGSTDALANSSDNVPIVLPCRLVRLGPLDTGCEGERCNHVIFLSAGKSRFQPASSGTNRYRI